MRTRLTSEAGFGLIELLIAMTVMAVGISAIVAGFSSGIVALNTASRTGTAGTLADKQMEAYRAVEPDTILPPSVPNCAADASPAWEPDLDCQRQDVTGPDGRAYVVNTSVVSACPIGPPWTPPCTGARPVKTVTIAVQDGVTSRTYFRETSTFDDAT